MNLIEKIQQSLVEFTKKHFNLKELPAGIECTLNTDHEKSKFGDISSNAAMVMAKLLKQNPRTLAQEISSSFSDTSIEKTEIAGPGFINFFLTDAAYKELAKEIFSEKEKFFVPKLEKKQNINIEFVSANPTGPLHIGHGRGGIIGDVLAKVLTFVGHNVTKEFYINDAGSQITKLGISLKIRYLQELGQKIEFPEDGYQGSYLKDLAKETVQEHGKSFEENPDE